MAAQKRSRRTAAPKPAAQPQPAPKEPRFGIRLIRGCSYHVDGKKFLPQKVYAVDRATRDRLVGGRSFADAVLQPGQKAHPPEGPGRLPYRGLTHDQRRALAVDDRNDRLRKRADLGDQSQIGARMDPSPHVQKMVGKDEFLELDPVGPAPVPLDQNNEGVGPQPLGDYEDT